jgi:assimilatory nitrate reductase catalytic subunit
MSLPETPITTRSTCPYCGVGCGVLVETQGGEITNVTGDPDHPANYGKLCSKGASLHLTTPRIIQMQTRLLQPMLRASKGAAPVATDWATAQSKVVNAIASAVQNHGAGSVGVYASGQLLTEDYYVFNKFVKGLLGTNNLDTNSRLCMSSAVAGYKATLGGDSVPTCYEDIDQAHCLLIAGSNMAYAHPILYRRVEAARIANPNLKTIVIDPRRTDTASEADLHLAIAPGSDVALFQGMLHIMLWEGWLDTRYIAAHTAGFEALKAQVRDMTPDLVDHICGISKADIALAAQWFAQSPASLSLYCQGLNQSADGTHKNAALINLHLATGQIGKAGAGPFSLTGQPNAMGGREVGGMANLLPAHRNLANPAHRAEVADFWGVDAIAEKPGLTAVELFEAAADGAMQVLWIACTNPAHSLPDQATVRRALERTPTVIVQDAFKTIATAQYADILLPAATWGEKDGTVTNSERRISRQRAVLPTFGESRPDWQIVRDIGRELEVILRKNADSQKTTVRPEPVKGLLPAEMPFDKLRANAGVMPSLFNFQTPESIWLEHRAITAGTDCDITGLSYAQLEAAPQQWPFAAGAVQGTPRLFTDSVFPTATGKAQFFTAQYKPVNDPVNVRHPIALTTGRLRDQWHGASRTALNAQSFAHAPTPAIDMHFDDMARRSLATGDLVQITSKRGAVVLPVQASDTLRSGQAHLAMHWGSEWLPAGLGINALTNPKFDPASKQPELKHVAVRVQPANLTQHLHAFAWLPVVHAYAAHEAISALLKPFAFASVVRVTYPTPVRPESVEGLGGMIGISIRVADHEPFSKTVLSELRALLNLNGGIGLAQYADPRNHHLRLLNVAQDSLTAVLLTGDAAACAAASWLQPLWQQGASVKALGSALLKPSATVPTGAAIASPMVCSCVGVNQAAIESGIAAAPLGCEVLPHLQQILKCGTECGSCVPQIKQMISKVGKISRVGS